MFRFQSRRLVAVTIATAAALLLCMAFFACSSSEKTDDGSKVAGGKLADLSFRLKWVVYSSFGSHYVALEKGYFENQGLNVTIEPGGPGIDPIRLVATGTDDVGLAGYEQILMAREKGIPLVAIGEDYIRSGVGFFSLQTSGIKRPEDFIGHRVGILPGTDKYTLYSAMMKKLGIDRSKIEEVPIAFDLTVLFNGSVDVVPGFVTNQPFVAEERGYPVNIVDPYDYGIRPGGNVYFTSEETLRKKRPLLKEFLRGAMEGIIKSQQLPDSEVVDMVMKYNDKLDRNAEIKIWKSTKDVLLSKDPATVGLMSPEMWEYTLQISVDYGLISEAPSLDSCYTNELVQEILDEGI